MRQIITAYMALACLLAFTGCKEDDPAPIVTDHGGLMVKLKLSSGNTGGMRPSEYETSGLDINNFVIICWEKSDPKIFYSMDYDRMNTTPLRLPVGEFTMEVMYDTLTDGSDLVSYGTKDFTILKDQITEVTYTVTTPKK